MNLIGSDERPEQEGSSLLNLNQNDVNQSSVTVECSNVSLGCPAKEIPVELLESHEAFECEYRPVVCLRPGCALAAGKVPLIFKMMVIHQEFECTGKK